MNRKIDTLIVGGTYFGMGYASSHPGCVIIEASQMLGGDFHCCARPADVSGITSEEGNTPLAELMKKYQVWEEGKFDTLKASLVIHEYAAEMGDTIQILLDARVISVKKTDSRYEVRYIDNEGIHTIFCDRILDTTVCRDTCPDGVKCTGKTLNVFTVSVSDKMDEKIKNVCPECIIVKGKNTGERIVRFPFAPDEKMLTAYRHVTDLWKKAFSEAEERILFIAEDFEYTCEESGDEKAPCPWNAVKYANPLTAFAEGMNYQII